MFYGPEDTATVCLPKANMTKHAHVLGRPRAGYYRARKRRADGASVWVPAIIWAEPARDPDTLGAMDRQPSLRCRVDGQERDPGEAWTSLHPITQREYMRMCDERLDANDDDDLMTSKVRL